ncbi:MAG: ABC transporter permease subunit [Rhodomicrobiaceae bacterium]
MRAAEVGRRQTAFLSLGVLALVWWLAAIVVHDATLLPDPLTVTRLIWHEAASGSLAYHLTATLARVVASFVLAMTIGVGLGLAMGRSEHADRWLDPWLIVFLNMPALVIIVLCYLWIGLTEAAAIAAVAINKVPMAAAMIREGARTLDPELDAMAKIYRMSAWARFRHVHLPQLAPHIAAAARAGVALIWKIVLVVEFLGRPNGIGFQIHLYFQLFDVGMVLAYALSFVVVMLAIETWVLQPWERSASRWRTA